MKRIDREVIRDTQRMKNRQPKNSYAMDGVCFIETAEEQKSLMKILVSYGNVSIKIVWVAENVADCFGEEFFSAAW